MPNSKRIFGLLVPKNIPANPENPSVITTNQKFTSNMYRNRANVIKKLMCKIRAKLVLLNNYSPIFPFTLFYVINPTNNQKFF